jgi:hypothetical protein
MTEVVVFMVGGAVILGSVVMMARRAAERRAAEVRDTAARLGWTFRGEVPYNLIPDLDRFELFRQGHSKKLRNVMTSPSGDPRAVLFEYSYVVSTGKSSHTYRQTVFYGTSDALRLPTFSVRPERFYHNIATMFGYQDIDLEVHPGFSERFLLRSDNEAEVRAVFAGPVAEFFEKHEGMCAAGKAHELLYWRPNRVAGTEGIEPLIAEGMELSRRFVAVQGPA